MAREVLFDGPDRTEWIDTEAETSGIDWKPGSHYANSQVLQTKLEAAIPLFAANVANWPTMTLLERNAAGLQAQRAILNILRHIRGSNSAGEGA